MCILYVPYLYLYILRMEKMKSMVMADSRKKGMASKKMTRRRKRATSLMSRNRGHRKSKADFSV